MMSYLSLFTLLMLCLSSVVQWADGSLFQNSKETFVHKSSKDDVLPRNNKGTVLPRIKKDATFTRFSKEYVQPESIIDAMLPKSSEEEFVPKSSRDAVLPRSRKETMLSRSSKNAEMARSSKEDVQPANIKDTMLLKTSDKDFIPKSSRDAVLPRNTYDKMLPRNNGMAMLNINPRVTMMPSSSKYARFPRSSKDAVVPTISKEAVLPISSRGVMLQTVNEDTMMHRTSKEAVLQRNIDKTDAPRREHIRLNLDWADNWGDWGSEAFCPDEYFATAFQIKVQSYDGAVIDDTAINAIQLICNHAFYNTTKATQTKEFPISSLQAPWGDWRGLRECSGWLTALRMLSDPPEGMFSDDLAACELEMACDWDPEQVMTGGGITQWGTWSSWEYCPHGWAICGLQTRVDPDTVTTDETALNNVKMFCCELPEGTY